MKKYIGGLILRLRGWKIEIEGDLKNLDRCVLVVAPHASNWDFVYGICTYWKLKKKLKVIIKDSHTKAFYGKFIKKLGGIGIDRSKKNDLINKVVKMFEKENFSLVITPEGSRSYAKKWKLGFHHIASMAKVPVVLATADYKKRNIKIGYAISVEQLEKLSVEEILEIIQNRFLDIVPKYPENYNPKIY